MKRNGRLILTILSWILTLAWLALSFFLSFQDGPATTSLSLRISVFLVRFLGRFGVSVSLAAFHMALRSFAHFGVFCVQGFLFASTALLTFPHRRLPLFLAVLVCAALAVMGEVIKQDIPGRHLSWPEAGLNTLGVLAGAALALLISFLVSRRKCPRSEMLS